jgi:hypothetical protein
MLKHRVKADKVDMLLSWIENLPWLFSSFFCT